VSFFYIYSLNVVFTNVHDEYHVHVVAVVHVQFIILFIFSFTSFAVCSVFGVSGVTVVFHTHWFNFLFASCSDIMSSDIVLFISAGLSIDVRSLYAVTILSHSHSVRFQNVAPLDLASINLFMNVWFLICQNVLTAALNFHNHALPAIRFLTLL
jgi:hypothetical protein